MFSSLKRDYLSELNEELVKIKDVHPGYITEQDLSVLPLPVQRFFRSCGYLGAEKMLYANIEWENTYLKLSPHSGWKKITCTQFNAVEEPARLVYMSSKILNVFPFEGKDKYKDGHGNMKIRLLNLFNVADAKGREMDASALVTVLAEALLVPSYALQHYITWKAIDDTTAKATITNNGTRVSGTFYFNESGRFVKFETEDRYYSEKGNNYKRMNWSVVARCYKTINGICFPSFYKATWHTPQGDYVYYKGWIKSILFNGKHNYEIEHSYITL